MLGVLHVLGTGGNLFNLSVEFATTLNAPQFAQLGEIVGHRKHRVSDVICFPRHICSPPSHPSKLPPHMHCPFVPPLRNSPQTSPCQCSQLQPHVRAISIHTLYTHSPSFPAVAGGSKNALKAEIVEDLFRHVFEAEARQRQQQQQQQPTTHGFPSRISPTPPSGIGDHGSTHDLLPD